VLRPVYHDLAALRRQILQGATTVNVASLLTMLPMVARIVVVPAPTARTRLLLPGSLVATATSGFEDEYVASWVTLSSVPPAK
jgi:hypothetical protein